ncbi:hypothetical protein [Anthocerotibacter panamensis]|uniref:hypothetical protein n=1 Tax=Anthocerotibacter panamensis TaxID=2857077 RepID=UPI001C404ADA|nr:hypothetical protein [Anthocerotibacter panamensis]
MKSWLVVAPVLLLVSCAGQPVAQTPQTTTLAAAPPSLNGDNTGKEWQGATPAQKLEFCRASMTSYRSSGTASFSISAKTNSLTPEKLCTEMDSYYSSKGTGLESDRLGHAAGMSIIFAGKPYKPPAP